MTVLAEGCGFCCLYGFLAANKSKRSSAWAKELGVSVRTVQYARELLREKITVCKEIGNDKGCARFWLE